MVPQSPKPIPLASCKRLADLELMVMDLMWDRHRNRSEFVGRQVGGSSYHPTFICTAALEPEVNVESGPFTIRKSGRIERTSQPFYDADDSTWLLSRFVHGQLLICSIGVHLNDGELAKLLLGHGEYASI